MKKEVVNATCARLFEVEALRDGRLTGGEFARFQSHIRTCTVCAGELSAMEGLAGALRSVTAPAADELHVRRERMRLLSAFDASLVPARKETRGGRYWAGALAVLAVLAVLATLTLLQKAPRSVTPVAASADAVKIQASTTSKWSRQADSLQETIRLESGTLSIHVDHRLSQRRLRVLLPDGELEDIGTTFSVTAAASRTTGIAVQEGAVILRLRDQPAVTLRAGDTWSPTPVDVSSAKASSPPPPPTVRRARPVPSAALAPNLSASAPAPAFADSPDPAADFRVAMSAFTSGDNARAASLFAAFLSQYPRDSHGEDAAYLRVLTLQRAFDARATKKAAREYLVRYPHGFRYAEMEALSR